MGSPLPDGPHDLVFELYPSDVGGVSIWSESQTGVQVTRGYFSVTLGSVTPLGVPFDQPYWLEVAVDGGAALQPRIPLASAPYALSVQTPLPPGTLYSNSLVDAPGIAQNTSNYGTIGGAGDPNYANALSVTINTPAPGYIVVTADATLVILCYTWVGVQISETSHAPQDGLHYFLAGGASPGLTNEGYMPVSLHRTYFKPAGTYTFYLQGRNANFSSCIPYMFNPTITALFVPTSYGSVIAAPGGPGPFAAGQVLHPGANPPPPLAPGSLVDLRELELRALRSETEARRARHELEQAQSKAARSRARMGGGK
ncbi:MAG: hypothetical protein HZB25_05590 [Candidatus Eisenbacteria bacterium]|nr:hypothetical protein [Candidatus Eisenbacteria bacterium]